MKTIHTASVLGLALLLAAAAAGLPSAASEARTLNGEFYWEGGETGGDLEAVFTPTGDGTWDVAFRFEFRGKPHTYTGTAKGSLTAGELSGVAQNENGKRTWEFQGAFADGEFSGTHVETTEGRQKTGTLTLR